MEEYQLKIEVLFVTENENGKGLRVKKKSAEGKDEEKQ